MGVAFLGVFCSGLAYIAWYDALKELSTAQTGAFLYIEPLVAVVVAATVLAEQVTWASLLGGAVILFGSVAGQSSQPINTGSRKYLTFMLQPEECVTLAKGH